MHRCSLDVLVLGLQKRRCSGRELPKGAARIPLRLQIRGRRRYGKDIRDIECPLTPS